jgi:hypothetical protein
MSVEEYAGRHRAAEPEDAAGDVDLIASLDELLDVDERAAAGAS